jgi:hypothetical protein
MIAGGRVFVELRGEPATSPQTAMSWPLTPFPKVTFTIVFTDNQPPRLGLPE